VKDEKLMKNICMISQSPYPFDPRVRRQAEKLAGAGFEVDILCLPIDKDPAMEKFGERITAYRILKKNSGQENITKYLWQSFRFFIAAFMKLQTLNRRRKYIMIQVHNMPEVHIFTAVLQKLKGTPLILDIHDLTPELLTSKWDNKLSRLFKPITVLFEKISCSFADHIITVTEGCKEILNRRSAPSEKITLVLNTANTSIFPFDKERVFRKIDRNLKLLYHGTVAKRFGVHTVVEAMPAVIKAIPGTTFRVFGKYDADYKVYLEKRIDDLNLQENVILGDARTHEELYEIIKDSDIEVVPYVSNEYMNLSLSTKAFECAAAGLPVVSTNLKTMKTAFDDTAIMYAEDNFNDFAEKIITLSLNPKLRETMTGNALKALEGISGDVMEERYLKLIETITGICRTENDFSLFIDKEPRLLKSSHKSKNKVI
jgi:glycosyltransferase involved in cell wall biosynthesis